MKENSSLAGVSIVCTSLLFPATYLFGMVIGYILKSLNPSQVNITSGLAYLAPIIYSSILVYIILLMTALITGLMALKTTAKKLAQLSLALLSLIFVMTVIMVILQQVLNALTK